MITDNVDIMTTSVNALKCWGRPCFLKCDRGRVYIWRKPCLLKCDKDSRVYIWQRPCLYKCDGGRSEIYNPNVCLFVKSCAEFTTFV